MNRGTRRGGERASPARRSTAARKILFAIFAFWLFASFAFVCLEAFPPPPTLRLPLAAIGDPCGLGRTFALDQPMPVRYLVYLANVFRGQWGATWAVQPCRPVLDLVLSRAPDTLVLTFGGAAIAGVLARVVAPGLARRRGRWPDRLGCAAALAASSVPPAGLGLLLLLTLMSAAGTPLVAGDHSPDYLDWPVLLQAADYVGHLIVPLLAVAASSSGFLILAARSASLRAQSRRGPQVAFESLAGYPTALGERRFGVPPILPEVAPYLGWTMGAALVVEVVFMLDGLGSLLWQAFYDVFVLIGIFLLLSLVLIVVSTVLEIVAPPVEDAVWPSEPPLPREEGPRSRRLRALVLSRAMLAGWLLLLILAGLAAWAPEAVGPYWPFFSHPDFAPPSPDHLLGVGPMGIDVLSAVLAGGQVAFVSAAWAFGIALGAGLGVALAAGCLGGRADAFAAGIVRVLLLVPWFPMAVLLTRVSGTQGYPVLGILAWPIAGWALRADVIASMAERGFPETRGTLPRASGPLAWRRVWNRSTGRILASLSPAILSQAFLAASLSVLMVAGIGMMDYEFYFGIARPVGSWPSWGSLLGLSFLRIASQPWYAIVPYVLAIFATSLTFALLAFSFRETMHALPSAAYVGKETRMAGPAESSFPRA